VIISGNGAVLRWGVAGYGEVVCDRALPGLAELGQNVAGIWGRDPERAAATAARYGAGRGFAEFGALLAEVDAVYVATPVAAHVPLALAALEAGRHVLVEKPLGGALGYDAGRLLSASRGLVGAVAYYRRLAPAMLKVKELMAGRGPAELWSTFRGAFDPAPGDPKHWRTLRAVSGGGVLADAGSHRLDLLCWLLGRPATVHAKLARPFPGGAERSALLAAQWADGSTARLRCDWTGQGLPLDAFGCAADDLVLSLPRLDCGLILGHDGGTRLRLDLPPGPSPLVPVLRDFLRCADTGRAPACPLADAVAVDELIRSASEDTGRPADGLGVRDRDSR
jgi:predicted dehydrogenase